jgi:hypothetical protein
MRGTNGLTAALPLGVLLLGCCALTGGCDGSAATPPLRLRAASAAPTASEPQRAGLIVRVLELREQHGTVTVVLQAAPQDGAGALYVGHYDLSCALGRMRMADRRGNAVRISDPVLSVGSSTKGPAYVSVPEQGVTLAVELLDERRVVTATQVRGVVAAPRSGVELAYSLDATIRVANGRLDGFMEVPVSGSGILIYRRG